MENSLVKRTFTDLPKELEECVQCHWALPLSEFYGRLSSPRGHITTCRKCTNSQRRARLSHQVRSIAYSRQYRKDNPRSARSYYYKYKYGITADDYDSMYADQKGCCLICDKHKDSLVIDHDHITGTVRGLLCYKCNTGIGQLQDDVSILAKAIKYIKKHSNVGTQDRKSSQIA